MKEYIVEFYFRVYIQAYMYIYVHQHLSAQYINLV